MEIILLIGYVVIGILVFCISYVINRVEDGLSYAKKKEDLDDAYYCGALWPYTIVIWTIVAFKYGLDRLAEYIYHKSKKKKETKD